MKVDVLHCLSPFHRTTTKVSRIQEFIDTEGVPDLTAEEIHDIEEAGGKLHKRIYMRHVFED
jgi:hypothetical protein